MRLSKTFAFSPDVAEQVRKLAEVMAWANTYGGKLGCQSSLYGACDKGLSEIVKLYAGELVLEWLDNSPHGYNWGSHESLVACVEASINEAIAEMASDASGDLVSEEFAVVAYSADRFARGDEFVNDRRERIAREHGSVGDWQLIDLGWFGWLLILQVPVSAVAA